MQAFTQTNARLILGYSSVAQLGFITLGIFALDAAAQGAQGALLQAVNHGLVVAPLFFVVALLAERAEGSEDIRDYGGIAFRAPVLAAAVPDRRAGDAGDARLGELRRRVPDPARRVQRRRRRSRSSRRSASCWPRSTRCGMYIRSMHNRVGPRVSSFELSLRDALVLVPLVLAILAFALYPQLALESGEEAVRSTVQAVAAAMSGLLAQADGQGPGDQLGGALAAVALTAGACVVLLVGLARARGSCAAASCRC